LNYTPSLDNNNKFSLFVKKRNNERTTSHPS